MVLQVSSHKSVLESELSSLRTEISSLRPECELFRAEQSHLQRAILTLEERLRTCEGERDSARRECSEALKDRQIALERALEAVGDERRRTDHSLRDELVRWQQKATEDVNRVRSESREAAERECRVLQQIVEETRADRDRIRSQLLDLTEASESQRREYVVYSFLH